jgi:hypothetical protein
MSEDTYKWWAGTSLGPFDSKEQAIQAGREKFTHPFYVSLAAVEHLKISEFVEPRLVIEDADSMMCDDADHYGLDDSQQNFILYSEQQLKDFELRMKKCIDEWQENNNLIVKRRSLTDVKEEIFVPIQDTPLE